MFGYITVNKQELKFKEFDLYQSYYCGLCRVLREKYGLAGQFALSYDCTFLVMFLTGLYEPESQAKRTKCVVHPVRGCKCTINSYTEYAADMTILLSYYKCLDDWRDEKKVTRGAYAQIIKSGFEKVRNQYPEKCNNIERLFGKIAECENNAETNIDKVSGLFGEILAEIFVCNSDEWEQSIRKVAFFLGKFVYLMDAYDDLEKDQKSGNYNPFKYMTQDDTFEENCRNILRMMMAECAREFEILPIIENLDILRNILYSGVWCRYEEIKVKKGRIQNRKEENNE